MSPVALRPIVSPRVASRPAASRCVPSHCVTSHPVASCGIQSCPVASRCVSYRRFAYRRVAYRRVVSCCILLIIVFWYPSTCPITCVPLHIMEWLEKCVLIIFRLDASIYTDLLEIVFRCVCKSLNSRQTKRGYQALRPE